MRVGNGSGNSQPIEMEQTIQETSETSDVQAANQSQSADAGAELENMKDPRWNRTDPGQIAEHELSGSLMAAQLNSQLTAAKSDTSETQPQTEIGPGYIPVKPNDGFERKLAKGIINAGIDVR